MSETQNAGNLVRRDTHRFTVKLVLCPLVPEECRSVWTARSDSAEANSRGRPCAAQFLHTPRVALPCAVLCFMADVRTHTGHSGYSVLLGRANIARRVTSLGWSLPELGTAGTSRPRACFRGLLLRAPSPKLSVLHPSRQEKRAPKGQSGWWNVSRESLAAPPSVRMFTLMKSPPQTAERPRVLGFGLHLLLSNPPRGASLNAVLLLPALLQSSRAVLAYRAATTLSCFLISETRGFHFLLNFVFIFK